MSWLPKLFGSKPPANSVVIAADLVAELSRPDETLSETVDSALRAYLGAIREAEAKNQLAGIPFWLRRDEKFSGELEEQLRDRVSQRHAGEDQE